MVVRDPNTGVIRRVAIPADLQIGLDDQPGELHLLGRLSLAAKVYSIDNVNKGVIGITNNDTVVALTLVVTPLSGRITCTLPPDPRDGQIHFIKDYSGTAGTVPIDIVAAAGTTIDNLSSKTLVDPYGSLALIWLENQWRILVAGLGSSGGSGAPTNASYVTINAESSLTAERRLTGSANILMTDNGPGATVSFNLSQILGGGAGTFSYATVTADAFGRITAITPGVTPPSPSLSYLTAQSEAGLTNERVMSGGLGTTVTDGSTTFSFHVNPLVIPFLTGTNNFTSPNTFTGGLTGSLQRLPSGPTYLVGVGGITITTASNGQVSISGAGITAGSGADPGAAYIVVSTTASLPNERALEAGYGLRLQDGGAGGNIIVSMANSISGAADVSASYITIGNTGSLPNERALQAGYGVNFQDGGANDKLIISFAGSLSGSSGISGINLSGSGTPLAGNPFANLNFTGAGVSVSNAGNGVATINVPGGSVGGGAGEVSASYVVLGLTSSLANERVLTAGPGITITDNGSNTVVVGTVSGQSALGSSYTGYTTASVWWNETSSWTPFNSGTFGHFVDVIQRNIIRNDAQFTVYESGSYYFHASFNAYANDAYVTLRLSGSNGIVLQRSTYRSNPTDQNPVTLEGVFDATSGSVWRLEYIASGTVYAWTASNPLSGGDNMRTGEVSMFRATAPAPIPVPVFSTPILAGTVTTNTAHSGSKTSLGMMFYNPTLMGNFTGQKAFWYRAIVDTLSTEPNMSASVDLYDLNGIVAFPPATINASIMSSSSPTSVQIQVNLTTVMNAITGSGILEARLWRTVSGSLTSSVACRNARIDVEFT